MRPFKLSKNIFSHLRLSKNILFYNFSSDFFKNLHLNPYLFANLKENKISEPTSIQVKSLEHVINGENAVVTAETGSGKTLCYLLPVMNHILSKKLDLAPEVYRQNSPRGAIILVPTKELGAQVYAMIRRLDKKNKLDVSRTGSIGYIAPISDDKQPKDARTSLRLNDLAFESVVRGIDWDQLDILVSTPSQLDQMLKLKDQTNPYQVDPKFIVIDEFDLLLGDTNIARSTISILNRFCNVHNNPQNINRQFILTGASFPLRINNEKGTQFIDKVFKRPICIESENFYKISEKMKHVVIRVNDYLNANPNFSIQDILVDQIKKSTSQRIIVFVQSQASSESIAKHLQDHDIKALSFHANLNTEQRIDTLANFDEGKVRVLVSTDLASRGLDFQNVDHVIQFDFALDAVSFLHRVGRTCRMGRNGVVTSFVRENDEFLYEKVQKLICNHQRIDPIISRKRSLSKNYKRSKGSDDEMSSDDDN
ncbi:DEAD-box ATP-dependent RNA helicase (macronuclear) [Tetrahymena thermophila SB210]|uniref:DEAD-box ATP-dependent RNA helicase n=1 Tax=Tetrahymena thermophila (strain SB210) TaxID=312017 RepID=I7LZY6_TETTS|nr:DEAD-box ATP-dependent RNA helicase [Tetrahymena thermophila SB210]EAR85148.2 DEAD-box ATP-dependent RNA helicase [Tetrahymena thermophila SB210]|eukprot:XP_001032811.2 DEAD-box ATP-dependent RNA helicase [Tetrahymena thermophila SB210]